MTSKTALWDKLGKTDPAHTKQFKRAGGFSGTAIKPMWSYRRMTEEFGPCGIGWGINEPQFQVVPANDEMLVYCTVSVWHEKREQVVFGVGGDKAAGKNKFGPVTDDEAFKKAFTDAVTNALKMIGVGADVHMGLFDDNKYVNAMEREFSDHKEPEPAPLSAHKLKKDGAWEKVSGELDNDLLDCHSLVSLEMVKADYREKVVGWPSGWKKEIKEKFDIHEAKLIRERERQEADNDFPGDTSIRDRSGRALHTMES